MCCPISPPTADKIIAIFKMLEWFFALLVILTACNLMCVRFCFKAMVKLSNWAIKFHGFDGGIVATDKAFHIYRRDLYILLLLNMLVLILIRML